MILWQHRKPCGSGADNIEICHALISSAMLVEAPVVPTRNKRMLYIRNVNNRDLSLHDLDVFIALLRLQNLTETGRELDVSQAAVSRCVAKLRKHFGDPLFVRAAGGVQPTPRALSLAAGAGEILKVYVDHMSERRSFDPKRSGRTFQIAASELGTVMIIDSILPVIQSSSSGLRLCVNPLNSQSLVHGLESGDIDLAVGGFPSLHPSVRQQLLFHESYKCLVRASHPFLRQYPTIPQFLAANHLIVSAHGSGHAHSLAEGVLRRTLDPRNARVECYSFLAAATLAERSDIVVTAPSKTLSLVSCGTTLQALDPPIELPTFALRQYWHERFHDDEGHTWLRHTLAALLQPLGDVQSGRPGPSDSGGQTPQLNAGSYRAKTTRRRKGRT